jgi:hypothetical protein
MFIRFVSAERDKDSNLAQGIFRVAYDMRDRGDLATHEEIWFDELDQWFRKHLRRPSRYAWSSRPNAPKRAVTWLKLSSVEHVRRLRELAALLRHKDVMIEEVVTDRPGYVLYEDQHQVVAMPFTSETFDR